MRFSALKAATLGALALLTSPAQAALITQTISFEETDFSLLGNGSVSPPFSTVSGTVVLTYDDATTTDIIGQAVDSVTFSTPTGVLEVTDVLFDLRVPPNVTFPQHTWEIDIYGADQGSPVSAVNAADWLLYVVGLTPLGADFNNTGVASQLLYSDGQFLNTGEFGVFSSSTNLSLTGSSVPAGSGTPVPAPTALLLLGLGLAGTGLLAKRRQDRATETHGMTPALA